MTDAVATTSAFRQAFHLVMSYVNRFPRSDHSRVLFLWGPCSSAKNKADFVQFFLNQKLEFAVLPDTESVEWDEKQVQELMQRLPEPKSLVVSHGCAVAHLMVEGNPITVHFLKREQRSRGVYLVDEVDNAVNCKHWVQTKIFLYNFHRPKHHQWLPIPVPETA
jgi:hypothetical protein